MTIERETHEQHSLDAIKAIEIISVSLEYNEDKMWRKKLKKKNYKNNLEFCLEQF